MSELELDDDSGPVSPRFQWSVHAVCTGDRLRLKSRGALLGAHDRELAITGLPALVAELEALGLAELVSPAREGRVGTRECSLRVGEKVYRYLPSDVDERLDATAQSGPMRVARGKVLAFLREALQKT